MITQLKMAVKNVTSKFISALLVFSILLPNILFYLPEKNVAFAGEGGGVGVPSADSGTWVPLWLTNALQGVTASQSTISAVTDVKQWAETILQNMLKMVAKRVLAKMTQSIINWINSDFHGSPLFLENPGMFFKDIAKSEIRNMVDMIGYNTLGFPFGKQTALNIINSYRSQLAINSQYTLSKVINDPDLLVRYRNDFNVGGWNGFLINTQYPQNNYLGFQMIIQDSLATRLQGTFQAPAQKVQSALQQGMGFLSPQTCPSNPSYNNGTNEFVKPQWNQAAYNKKHPIDYENDSQAKIDLWNYYLEEEKDNWARQNTCPGGLVSTTPGSVAANQVFSALNAPILQTALDGAIGNSLSAIFDALINHFIDKGLNAIGGAIAGGGSKGGFGGSNNWSYMGQKLDSEDRLDNTNLNIPNSVSVTIGETTNTFIYGGRAPYSILENADSAVATAKISTSSSSGPKLSIKGVGKGATNGVTSVTVQDSSTPAESVRVDICVRSVGDLMIRIDSDIESGGEFRCTPDIDSGADFTITANDNDNDPVYATISGGKAPYFLVRKNLDENIAIVAFADSSLIIRSIAPGETSFIIKDSAKPPQTKEIKINISGIGDMIIPTTFANINRITRTSITGGTPPYSIFASLSPYPTVATAKISGSDIIVTGVSDGNAIFVIQDSSAKTANAQVTVGTAGSLTVQDEVTVYPGQPINLTISGGTPPYNKVGKVVNLTQTYNNRAIATAFIKGNILTITGTNYLGTARVQIGDLGVHNVASVTINVVKNGTLLADPKFIEVSTSSAAANHTATVNISGGAPAVAGGLVVYSATVDDPSKATASISGNTLTITGLALGETSVTVKDSAANPQSTVVDITVN